MSTTPALQSRAGHLGVDKAQPAGGGELFTAYREGRVLLDLPLADAPCVDVEAHYRAPFSRGRGQRLAQRRSRARQWQFFLQAYLFPGYPGMARLMPSRIRYRV